jgi:hypothetical protein
MKNLKNSFWKNIFFDAYDEFVYKKRYNVMVKGNWNQILRIFITFLKIWRNKKIPLTFSVHEFYSKFSFIVWMTWNISTIFYLKNLGFFKTLCVLVIKKKYTYTTHLKSNNDDNGKSIIKPT